MNFDCMTQAELDLWHEAASNPLSSAQLPCVDCPMAYHLAEKAAGRCDREPQKGRGPGRRYARVATVPLHGPGNPYPAEEERRAARRRTWRQSKARARQAQAA